MGGVTSAVDTAPRSTRVFAAHGRPWLAGQAAVFFLAEKSWLSGDSGLPVGGRAAGEGEGQETLAHGIWEGPTEPGMAGTPALPAPSSHPLPPLPSLPD